MTEEFARERATDYVLQRYHLADLREAQERLTPSQFEGVTREIANVQAQIMAQAAPQVQQSQDTIGAMGTTTTASSGTRGIGPFGRAANAPGFGIDTPLGRVLPVTGLLIVVNVAVFIAESLQPASVPGDPNSPGGSQDTGVLAQLGATVPGMLASGQYWRLFTACFLHIGLAHIATNMLALLWLGGLAERFYGPLRFLGIYLAAGIGGNVLTGLVTPNSVGAGASGAIFGILGAMLVASWRNREVIGAAASRAIFANLGQLLVLNIVISFLPGIGLWAHAGGALTGAVLALLIPFNSPTYPRPYRLAANALSAVLIVATLALLVTWIGNHGIPGLTTS